MNDEESADSRGEILSDQVGKWSPDEKRLIFVVFKNSAQKEYGPYSFAHAIKNYEGQEASFRYEGETEWRSLNCVFQWRDACRSARNALPASKSMLSRLKKYGVAHDPTRITRAEAKALSDAIPEIKAAREEKKAARDKVWKETKEAYAVNQAREMRESGEKAKAAYLIEFEKSYEESIATLIQEYMLEKPPPPLARAKLFDAAESTWEEEPELSDLIRKVCPEIMTDYWREQIREEKQIARQLNAQFLRDNALGKYAPEIKFVHDSIPSRKPAEIAATQPYIKILEELGVRDRALLDSLGNDQAKKLIFAALELRASANLTWEHVQGFSSELRRRIKNKDVVIGTSKPPSEHRSSGGTSIIILLVIFALLVVLAIIH